MRLTKIKLAGFKSFVDPTTVPLPSQLIGVVGPNGCGKSNIIDCVRWVMGESSAKYLRGESMTDVIFNGSSSRKPVNQASVELIFDNRDGTLGGQYASYNEISVKRQVNREGQSHYYLNGTRCRKRDVTDVFLGTGLGPRSYAIIEQGMISRMVEAKPEELRVYLEEAAGISLYKERRRETERRIRDTRENLERLNDVRDEVGRQLEKLKRQAEVAERYTSLRAEERQQRAELVSLRRRTLLERLGELEREAAQRENAAEAGRAGQREAEREIEAIRQQHTEHSEGMNAIQGRYYGLGSEITRLEQQINHRRELHERQQRDLDRSQQAIMASESEIERDRARLTELQARLEESEPHLEELRATEEEAAVAVAEVQERLEAWQEQWARFNEEAGEPLRTAQVERTRIEQLEARAQEYLQRRQRLVAEREHIDLDALRTEIEGLETERQQLNEKAELLDEQFEEALATVEAQQARYETLEHELTERRGQLQRDQARLTSLETLQEGALDASGVDRWLRERGWSEAPRLAREIAVEPGWERAVEVVLGERLQAICIEEHPSGAALVLPEQGRVTVLAAGGHEEHNPSPERLAAKVRTRWPVAELLAGVYWAEDLTDATARRAQLAPGESVVTRDGLWLGRDWWHLSGAASDAGVLERERELQRLREVIERETAALAELDEQREQMRGLLDETRARADELNGQRQELEQARASGEALLNSRRQRADELEARRTQLDSEVRELAEQIEAGERETREARLRLDEALLRAEALDEQRERLQAERETLQERVATARDALRERQELRHELSLKVESDRTAARGLEEGLARLRERLESLLAQREELAEALIEQSSPEDDLEARREEALAQRLRVEQEMNEARAQLAELEERLRELERRRMEADRDIQGEREALEQLRLKVHEHKIREQGELDTLRELGFDYDTLAREIPADAVAADWESRLEDLGRRIARLGPINLAAIDEYQTLDERKGYLDRQHDDLTEAMETLESAIRRIDRETRQRFKDTYDKVNAGMQRIFPRLFGGGQGYLELTGEDLLETGVSIMARPPGKRITNIHLLSGGEKALTAVALVFAIFELNPSPFCMLDEVDAPLDEANVGRFCNMLVEMSQRVQFIFITHNKATMEIAQHLTGVTMHEPGVSRLVAVDVAEAVELAAV